MCNLSEEDTALTGKSLQQRMMKKFKKIILQQIDWMQNVHLKRYIKAIQIFFNKE